MGWFWFHCLSSVPSSQPLRLRQWWCGASSVCPGAVSTLRLRTRFAPPEGWGHEGWQACESQGVIATWRVQQLTGPACSRGLNPSEEKVPVLGPPSAAWAVSHAQ